MAIRPLLNEMYMDADMGEPFYFEPTIEEIISQLPPSVINDLVSQISAPTYQPEPVYQPPVYQEPIYQPVYQPEQVFTPEPVYQPVYQPEPVYTPEPVYSAPQITIEEVISQLPPSVVNQLISQAPIQEVLVQDSAPTVETTPVVAPQQSAPQPPVEEPKANKQEIIDSLTKQILAQGTSDKWKGGISPEAAAKDMARIMANAGIADIRQLGLKQEVVPAQYFESGEIPEHTVNTYYNKETGKQLENTYAERQTGNAFGGTFEGKGNTGYRVDFAPDGTPVFYTTQSSSNDLFNILAQNPIINAAANYFAFQAGGPAAVAALNAAQGKSAEDVAKATLLSYAGGELSKVISPYLPTPETPIDFVGGTQESINDALQSQFVNDLKAAGVTNVSEFINNIGGNASSFVPPEVTPVVEPTVAPIENVQVSAPVAPTPTVNEVINAIVAQQPEVQVTAEQQPVAPTPVTPTVEEIVRTLTEPTPTPVAPVENVQVTAPVETTTPTVSEIINSIIQPVVTEPTVVEPVPQVVAPIETVQVTETVQPTAPTVSEVINAIAQIPVEQPPVQQVPTPVEVTAPREEAPKVETPQTVQQVIASIIPELVMTSQAPREPEQPIPTIVAPPIQDTVPQITTIAERPSTITNETEPAPVIVAPPITGTVPPKTYTASEIIDMIRLGVLGASVLGATTQETGPTGFPIVPVPADWKSPTYAKDLPSVAPTQLPPIDFGNRNLLIGTQWEKFLDPNYGKVPAPVQFNQPSDMSYDRLMSILGTSRDVLPSQALSINDVISGIQNQYGQTPTGSMG